MNRSCLSVCLLGSAAVDALSWVYFCSCPLPIPTPRDVRWNFSRTPGCLPGWGVVSKPNNPLNLTSSAQSLNFPVVFSGTEFWINEETLILCDIPAGSSLLSIIKEKSIICVSKICMQDYFMIVIIIIFIFCVLHVGVKTKRARFGGWRVAGLKQRSWRRERSQWWWEKHNQPL